MKYCESLKRTYSNGELVSSFCLKKNTLIADPSVTCPECQEHKKEKKQDEVNFFIDIDKINKDTTIELLREIFIILAGLDERTLELDERVKNLEVTKWGEKL